MSNVEPRTQSAIFIPPGDYDRLLAVADAAAKREPDAAQFLLHVLDRAWAREPQENVVRMGSQVRFRDETTGLAREVQLVYPQQADSAAGRISILTPVGTALIGLSEGQSMTWSDRSGKAKRLTVLEVKNRPETVA